MPDTSPEADLVFLPWVRQGARRRLDAPDTLGARAARRRSARWSRCRSTAATTCRGAGAADGAGQVTGIDPRQVVRTDPARGARNFEPNYFPLVEFDDPSLPWLFTPASANSQARLRPWLVLVVVPQARPGHPAAPPRTAAPAGAARSTRRRRSADELPDLADSWAWAHAQLAAPVGAGEDDAARHAGTGGPS